MYNCYKQNSRINYSKNIMLRGVILLQKKKTLVISSIVILTLAGLFFCIYYYFIGANNSSYEKSIKSYITKINKINEDINTYSANRNLNLDKINATMNKEVIDNLIQYKNEVTKLNPPEKYKDKQKYLKEGLENNIMIYKQCISIVNNPNNIGLDKAIDSLKKYRENTESNYELVKDKSFNIEFPSTLNSFIDMVMDFANTSIEKQKEEKVKESQNLQFKNSLELAKQKFEDLLSKNNYDENIKRIREGNRVFEPVLNSINKDLEDLSNIKISLSDISIPEKGKAPFDSLHSLLKDYELYLQNLNTIVTIENNNPDEYMENENIQKDYEKVNTSLEEILSKYKNLKIDL